jgi:ribosomal protein S18 acetylase RimI-like enzyme
MINQLLMIPAAMNDLEKIVALREEARAWLADNGIEQWKIPYPPSLVAQAIERGESYLAYLGKELVGTIRLQWSDEMLWGKTAEDAGYVHNLVVSRKFAGQGLGRQMLTWAEETAAKAGKRFLRLDCAANNEKLCSYYQRAGFAPRGIRTFEIEEFTARLFEKELTQIGT